MTKKEKLIQNFAEQIEDGFDKYVTYEDRLDFIKETLLDFLLEFGLGTPPQKWMKNPLNV